MRQRLPAKKDGGHRAWIASLECLFCGNPPQAAHVNYAEPKLGKRPRGIGEKADDHWCVPLCPYHHEAQHGYGNEKRWWEFCEVDPLPIALALYVVSGDHAAGMRIVKANQRR